MAGTLNAGSIIYEVDMDTARLLAARREVDAALNGMGGNMGRLEASVNRTERSISSLNGTMSKLSGVASAVVAALSVQQVTEYANSWINVSNKLVNAVRPTEELGDVTQRVFDISQKTMSSLEGTASLYGRLERATRSAGTSTADLTTLVSTINKGLAVSGATTQEATSTMIQLSQALGSGVLRGEEFNSISENGSRLAVALADSLGVTIGQLRKMANEGKLTTEVVVNGLLKQSDQIAKEFANTVTTMGQAFTIATNNITKFVGESSSVSTSIKVFNDGVISLSQNLDVVANVIAAAAVIFGGRFAGALALATKARIDDALAAKAQTAATAESAAATANAARVTALKAALDKEQALSNLALAQTEYNVARGTAAEAFALENLVAVKSVAIQRSATYAEAQLAEAAATRTAAAASAAATTTIGGLARGALALIGGPAGLAVIAAAGIFYFYQKMQQARQESIDFADKLDGVIAKMKSMSQVQLAAEIDNASKSIRAQADALKDNQSTLEANEVQQSRLRRTLSYLEEGSLLYKVTLSELSDAESEHTQLLAQNENAQNKLSQTVSKTGILRAQMNGTFAQGIDLLKRDGDQAGVAAGLMNQFGNAINFASRAKEKFNSTSLEIPRSDKADAYNKDLADENTLLAITDKRLRAVTKARMEAGEKGGNQNQINAAGQLAAAQYDLQQAEAARNKETKTGISEGKKAATQAESIAQKLANLKQQSDLAAESTKELTREKAILNAQQSLGKGATESDIRLAGDYAAKTFDSAKAVRDLAQAEQGRKFATQEIAAAKVMPDAQTGAVEDPISQINLQEQQKLAALAQYQTIDKQNVQIYEDAKTAIQQQASNARRKIAIDEANAQSQAIASIIGSVSQGFDGLANLAANAAGSSSGAYKAMFALSKGFAVAQSALNLQLAISQVMADPTALTPAQKFANYAAVAGAGASLLSTIGSISYGGGREKGGPVSAGSMYQVGEGGKPEIYQASTGKQYMIPGDNGKVISNKDMMGGGGGTGAISISQSFVIHTTNGVDEATQKQIGQVAYTQALLAIKDQKRPGGMLTK